MAHLWPVIAVKYVLCSQAAFARLLHRAFTRVIVLMSQLSPVLLPSAVVGKSELMFGCERHQVPAMMQAFAEQVVTAARVCLRVQVQLSTINDMENGSSTVRRIPVRNVDVDVSGGIT